MYIYEVKYIVTADINKTYEVTEYYFRKKKAMNRCAWLFATSSWRIQKIRWIKRKFEINKAFKAIFHIDDHEDYKK